MIYIPELQERTEWGWGMGATCQILVAVLFVIYVVMQIISTKINPRCYIVVIKSLKLPEASSATVVSKQIK
jgi:flagellar biogenesis protein FliO